MKKNIGLWQLVGFGVVSLLGTGLHFLYDLTESPVAALLSGVNESTWEHMKLLFFPMLLFALIEWWFIRNKLPAFWCIKLRGTVLGLLLIPVLFYTLQGIFGKTPDFVNIGIFFVSAAAAFLFEAKQLKEGTAVCKHPRLAFAILCIIALAFWVFTFIPPKLPLFADPINGSYGLPK